MSQKNVLNENKEPASADPEKTQNETPPEFRGKSEEDRRESDLHSDSISEEQARQLNASATGAAAPAASGAGRPDITNVTPDTSGSIDRGALNADAAGVPCDASQDNRTDEEKRRDINQENYEGRNADVHPDSPVQPGSRNRIDEAQRDAEHPDHSDEQQRAAQTQQADEQAQSENAQNHNEQNKDQ